MWTRDLQVFTVVYSFKWKERITDENDDFLKWGKPQVETVRVTVVAPSHHYVEAWVAAQHAHDPEAEPTITSVEGAKLDAIINPNHP